MSYPSPTSAEIRGENGFDENHMLWAFYNAVPSLFAISGPFVSAGILRLWKGSRKKTLFTIACGSCACWLLNLLTKVHIWAGIIARALMGVDMGAISCACPIYLSEIAPEGQENLYGCFPQLGVVFGFVIFQFIAPSVNSYMWLSAIAAIVSAAQAILVWFIRDSTVNEDNQAPPPGGDDGDESIFKGKNLRQLLIGLALMFFQQFSGVNAIATNLTDLMNESGLDLNPDYQAGIANLAQFIAIMIVGFLMKTIGHRGCWIASSIVSFVSLAVYAAHLEKNFAPVVPLVCIFMFQFGFGIALGPMPWFAPQFFSDALRPMASAIITASNWICAFTVILIWPPMRQGMGSFGGVLFFTIITVIGTVFGAFFVREPEGNVDDAAKSKENEGSAL
jgi:MFS family permease